MTQDRNRTRRDGWTAARRTDFLGALRVAGSVPDACAWVGMSVAGLYALVKRDPGFAAAREAALAAHDADRYECCAPKPAEAMDNRELMRRIVRMEAARAARPRGIVAQQNSRRAYTSLNFDDARRPDLAPAAALR